MVKIIVIILMVISPTLLYGLFGSEIAIIVNSVAAMLIQVLNMVVLVYVLYKMDKDVPYKDICPLLCGVIGISMFLMLSYDWVVTKTYIDHGVTNSIMWSVAHSFFAYAFYLMIYEKYVKPIRRNG